MTADGPYQTKNFKTGVFDNMGIKDILGLPVTWDAAHQLDLAVTDVRDSKSKGAEFFNLFIKRSNIFNHCLHNGKGYAYLKFVDENASRPVAYATQRFTSSAYDQWKKIVKSYSAYIKAFEALHPNRDDCEQWQYMIMGSDYIQDLLGLIDLMKPVLDIMLRMQDLSCPIWKLKLLWPAFKEKLKKAGLKEFLLFFSFLCLNRQRECQIIRLLCKKVILKHNL